MPALLPYPGRQARIGPPNSVPVSRDGRQTLSRDSWPIVVVPGIMGSRIERIDGSDQIWDPDDSRFMLGLAARTPNTLTQHYNPKQTLGKPMSKVYTRSNCKIDDRGAEAAIGKSREDRGWGSISWRFYGGGMSAIQAEIAPNGGALWGFGYDWRDSNIANGKKLAEFVQKTVKPSSSFKPIIITHSMGGLVTRAACKLYGMESMVSGVIHTLMPTYGAVEAYGNFKTGKMEDLLFQFLVGNTKLEIACVSSGVAGVFQLMPNQLYPLPSWLSVDPRLDAVCVPQGPYPLSNPYALYRESKGIVGLVSKSDFSAGMVDVGANRYVQDSHIVHQTILDNVKEAEEFHSQKNVGDYCHPLTWLLASTGRKSNVTVKLDFFQDQAFGIPLNPQAVGSMAKSSEGDSTVPLASARVLENHPNCQGGYTIAADADHAKAFSDSGVVDAISDLILSVRGVGLQKW